jgi:glycosyltransferase involved in cell wall biosynthesis
VLDVIIPCLNEGATIEPIVRALKKHMYIHKVIVVDNGSDDDTVINASKAGAFVIKQGVRGKGEAVAKGLEYVTSARVLLYDGDLTPPRSHHISAMARPWTRGMVIGVPDFTQNAPWAKPGATWNSVSGVRSLPVVILRDLNKRGLLHSYTMEVVINQEIESRGMDIHLIRLAGVKGPVRYSQARQDIIDNDIKWLQEHGYRR